MIAHTVLWVAASFTICCWVAALIGYLPIVRSHCRVPFGKTAFILGWLVMLGYLAWLWGMLERPPFRTMGETRLWYAALLPPISLLIEWRWRTRVLAIPVLVMASVFLCITLAQPEAMDRTLMPALDSPWFIPHVMAYMVAYALLGAAAAVAGWALVRTREQQQQSLAETVHHVRQLIRIAFPLLTFGMLLGAYWAQAAWGHFWTWDPKEMWALMTWACYLAYLHSNHHAELSNRAELLIVTLAFLTVIGCWFGVNALPNAQMSIHSYAQ